MLRKFFRMIIFVVSICILFLGVCSMVNATETHHLHYADVLHSEPKFIFGFSSFAVNSFGDFAIVSGNNPIKTIAIYNHQGTFVYGFEITDPGSVVVAWQERNLVVYSVRSNYKFVLNQDGTILSQDIFDESEYEQAKANHQIVNDQMYVEKHWLYNHELLNWGSYTKLVQITDNQEIVLFERPAYAAIFVACILGLFIVGFICLSVLLPIRKAKKRKI